MSDLGKLKESWGHASEAVREAVLNYGEWHWATLNRKETLANLGEQIRKIEREIG